MKHRYNIFFKNLDWYRPTQNLIVFQVIYSKSKTDKYKGCKLQSTLSSLTTTSTFTFTDFASRQVQYLAGEFLKRVLTII
jgi:hypothetical protein